MAWWGGILIQHATHDVGSTMTASIPTLIFHRFYGRLSSFFHIRSLPPPLPPSLYIYFSLFCCCISRPSISHGNLIFRASVKPVVCLFYLVDVPAAQRMKSLWPLISSFQNKNVMGRGDVGNNTINIYIYYNRGEEMQEKMMCARPRNHWWVD